MEGWRDGRLFCTQRNKVRVGDTLEAIPPRGKPTAVPVPALWDGEGRPIPDTPHPMMPFSIPFPEPLPPGTFLRKEAGA